MATPTVIKWTDSGAPVLSRVASSFIAILDFCLPQRGWTKEFSATDKAAYRSSVGERKFYRVLNDGSFYYSSITYQYCSAKITAYDTMLDIDTGAGQWGETFFSLSISGTAVTRPWMCVFCEKTVLFIVIPDKTTGLTLETANSFLTGFGETKPGLPGNTPRNFLAGHKIVSTAPPAPTYNYCPLSSAATYVLNEAYGRIHCNRSLDGTRLGIPVGLIPNGGTVDNTDIRKPFALSSTMALSYPYNGELLYARPMLDDGIAFSLGDYVPYLYYPCQKGNTFNNWGDYPSGAITFIAVRVVTLYSEGINTINSAHIGAVLLNISEEA